MLLLMSTLKQVMSLSVLKCLTKITTGHVRSRQHWTRVCALLVPEQAIQRNMNGDPQL